MARIIIKQKDGLFAEWSSIIDDFTAYDMTQKEFIECKARKAYEAEKERLEKRFENNEFIMPIDERKEELLNKIREEKI